MTPTTAAPTTATTAAAARGPLVLALETATPRCSVAVGTAAGPLASFSVDRDRRHVEALAPAIEVVTRAAGVTLADLAGVAVDVGPGLFTGMRAGIATAQGLALALGVGVLEVSSLDALAHPLRHVERPVVPVVDARRGEVFRALPGGAPGVVRPEALAAELGTLGPCLAVGDGAERHRAVLEAAGATVVDALPGAEAVLALALAADPATTGVDPGEVRPRYLRDADARPNFTVLVPVATPAAGGR